MVDVEEPAIAMASMKANPAAPLSPQPESSSSVLVAQLRLAPVAVQTSGSVILNSMTLLPAHGSIVKTQAATDSLDKSRFPAAPTVDNAGPSSEAHDTSEEQGKHPTSKVDKASEDKQGIEVSNTPTEGSVALVKHGNAHDGQEDYAGVVGDIRVECMAPTPADDASAITAVATTMLAEADVDVVNDTGSTSAIVKQETGQTTTIDRVVDSLPQQNNAAEGHGEHTDSVIIDVGSEDTRVSEVGAIEPKAEANGRSGGDAENIEKLEVFFPSEKFTGSRPGYLFKLGDEGLGFYMDGYVDCPTKGRSVTTSHRPWNAGPGKDTIRRGPMGPVVKSFTRLKKTQKPDGEAKKAADDSDSRPFMARMVAQRNSRGFQSALLGRENALDTHILALLEKFADDPTFFKKKHGYNVHGQMLGKDGKMIVKERVEKTAEEKAKLSWYRKVYEDRLGKQLPSKRLGDSIEARREAYAYSRYFTAELNGREDELDKSLAKALKGQTKLEFITEDYNYPGAYDTDGKVILEKGSRISNELHQTEDQKERACSYRFKAIQRFRDAHDDIVGAIAKKDKALQKMIKKTDPTLLQEIADECVQSSGMGIHRQNNRAGQDTGQESSGAFHGGPTEHPEQLRDAFSQSLKAQIKGRDKALMKEVAAMDEREAEQMMDDFGKGVEILPGSWRQDPANLKNMKRRRKELIAEIEADRRMVVCPWRPGGMHIARGPWKPFIPRDHRPPTRSASEEKAGAEGAAGAGPHDSSGDAAARGSGSRKEGAPRRPHTAPTPRRREFMDTISVRARRILAAQTPGTPLHSAFSTYSTDPFPLDSAHGQSRGTVGSESQAEHAASVFSLKSPPGGARADMTFQTPGSFGEGKQRAWVELSESTTHPRHSSLRGGRGGKLVARPQSATTEAPISRRVCVPPKRPSTASGTRNPASVNNSASAAALATASRHSAGSTIDEGNTIQRHENGEDPTSLHVRGQPGVTVLWARLCGPSDTVYKSSTWPSKPRAPTSSRRPRRRTSTSVQSTPSTNPPGTSQTDPVELSGGAGELEENVGIFTNVEGGERGEGNVAHAETELGAEKPLEYLEEVLLSSTWRRVHQRKRVFRGYADRARRERTWDPGSAFFADGASRHHKVCPRPAKERWSGDTGRDFPSASGLPGAGRNSENCRRDTRCRRSRVSVEVERPVDMDWKEMDSRRFGEAADEMKAALEGKLFAVVTDDENVGQLDECFREARELVDSASALLECPQRMRERFNQGFGGEFRIGSYVAAVSRLNYLWATTCGVIEIVRMVRTREELCKVFCSEDEHVSNVSGSQANEEPPREATINGSSPTLAGMAFREGRNRRYVKRLELAEYSMVIAESIKLWLSIVPWQVRVLYGGEGLISKLGAEEETLPWPPDTGSDDKSPGDGDQKQTGVTGSEATPMPVLRSGSQPYVMPCTGGSGYDNISGDVKLSVEGGELCLSNSGEEFSSQRIAGDVEDDAGADDVSEKLPAASTACTAEQGGNASCVGRSTDGAAVGVLEEAAYRDGG